MSLRAKLLGLFGLLAVLPLIAVGVFDYVRSIRALETLVANQATMFAERSAIELADRWGIVAANVALLAENEDAQSLYDAGASNATRREFLNGIWPELGRDLAWIEYHDVSGTTLFRLGEPSQGSAAREYVVHREIVDRHGRVVGMVRVGARLDSILPETALAARIGHSGQSLVVDRTTGDVLFDTRDRARDGPATPLLTTLRRWLATTTPESVAVRGTFNVREDDSTRTAAVVALSTPPLAILASGTLEEFSAPFTDILGSNLTALTVLVFALSAAFVALLFRATRTLSALTAAADEVGRGNLEPALPIAASNDEVGRLTNAFESMLSRLRSMLAEVEQSRQLAAVGQFASQISHEIRNPLTAIKLNLQRIERAASSGLPSRDLGPPIEIALRETNRLDRVVRGVLRLGRRGRVVLESTDINAAIAATVDRYRAQFEEEQVDVSLSLVAAGSRGLADRALLESALANLLLNAVDADASVIVIETSLCDETRTLRLTMTDNGHGLSAESGARAFEPFYSTTEGGSGLGLALVHRTVEEHHGTISIGNRTDGATGTTVVLELPLEGGGP
jgi:signal transduction histidine kinase